MDNFRKHFYLQRSIILQYCEAYGSLFIFFAEILVFAVMALAVR